MYKELAKKMMSEELQWTLSGVDYKFIKDLEEKSWLHCGSSGKGDYLVQHNIR